MNRPRTWYNILLSDTAILIWLALGVVVLHLLTYGLYGFHRDELATLDDGRYLDWGYVAYPPITPFIGRTALELFGPSLVGVRFFSSVAQALVLILSGLMARELGGKRWAQIVAAVAVAVAPLALGAGALLQYVAFDYLWWVLFAYLMIRLLKSEDQTRLGILAGNYGEAGALNLYGPAYGLPMAISGINSYWLRGYGDPPPRTLIVLGLTPAQASQIFGMCEIAGRLTNQYNVENEETTEHPDVLVCRDLRSTWPEFWKSFRYFG